MSTTTTRLALYKTASDGSELVNVVTDLLNNLDAIDLNIGYRDCTSSTRPSTVWRGLPIRESDTGRLYVSNGSAPASASWVQIPAEGATFVPAFTFAGALSLNSTLAVTGAATLGSTLGVTGAATMSSTFRSVGAASLNSTLAVTGATTLSSTLAVTGIATLSSNLSVAGSAAITGNTTVGGTLGVTGNFTGAANVNTSAWTSYSPTWAGLSALGSSTAGGRYCQVGKMVTVVAWLNWGTSSSLGTGSITVTLPFTAVGGVNATLGWQGTGRYVDSGGNAWKSLIPSIDQGGTTATVFAVRQTDVGWVSPGTAGYLWGGSSANMRVEFTYEAA